MSPVDEKADYQSSRGSSVIRPAYGLIEDSSMFLDMQAALLQFLDSYDRVYAPRGYQDADIAQCAVVARLAMRELASHTESN